MTVADDEIGIRSVGVPYGWPQSRRRTEPGYVLENGIVLLDSERDADGRYYGGAGMDGMFLRAPYPNRLFSPVRNPDGSIRAFRRAEPELSNEKPKGASPMAMKSSARNIRLESLDDIFSTAEQRQEEQGEKIVQIPLAELHPFKNHPFQVRDDEAMQNLAESIKKSGVYSPAIVRPRAEGGYELVAGHRRKHASELAGLETLPAVVREMDDDTATILMCDTNLQQRDNILPSERAFAYKLKLDAMKRQAGRPKNNSGPVDPNFGKRSNQLLAEQENESVKQVQRYIRLTELTPKLLELVDEGTVAFRPAVELSYLKPEEQTLLLDTIESEQATPSLSQAQRLKKFSQEGHLNEDSMLAIMSEEKGAPEKITLTGERLHRYFPKSYTPRQMEDTIIKLLEQWQRHRQHEQER